MKWSILILTLFTASFCDGQDSIFICKEKNLLIPEGCIEKFVNRHLHLIPECKNAEIILEGYDYLFIGFEKYGYTLRLDTIGTHGIDELIVRSQVVGYFDLVNNTDSTIKVGSIGWAIDNMGFSAKGNKDCLLKPGDSMQIEFVIVKGLWRVVNLDFDMSLFQTPQNGNSITSSNKYRGDLDFLKKLKRSKSYFRMYNRLTICDNYNVNVIFIIPVKYIRNIEYGVNRY